MKLTTKQEELMQQIDYLRNNITAILNKLDKLQDSILKIIAKDAKSSRQDDGEVFLQTTPKK